VNAFVLVSSQGNWKILRHDDLVVIAEGSGFDDLVVAIRRYYAATETKVET